MMNDSATLNRGQKYSVRTPETPTVARIRALQQQAQALNDLAAAIRREVRVLEREAGINVERS